MAAPSSADARGTPPAERFRLLRELGARAVTTHAALDRQPDGKTLVVVVERVARGEAFGDQEIADWVRDARRLATLEHPNVGRVRDVVIRGEEVLVVNDYVDGVLWSELAGIAPRPSLEIALRVFVDVLSGLSAVHNLRDAKREPLKLVHGELTPECVVVGLDGVARIVSACRVRTTGARRGSDGSSYLAPEVLLADESAGARADVYSVGVMLWEVLSGRALFPNMQPSAIVTQVLSGKVSRPAVPEGAAWAAPLADVALRALSADPEKRFASAAAFAAELRRIGGPKLAPPVRVAALVRGTFGDRIRLRREALERGDVPAPRDEVSGVESQPLSDVDPVSVPAIPSTAPTPLPPAPDAPEAPPLPPAAIKPPPLPNFRPRQPTLSGVAPPTATDPEPTAEARRVVVAPPTPFVAFEVPTAALKLDGAPPPLSAPQAEAQAPPKPPAPAPVPAPVAPPTVSAAVSPTVAPVTRPATPAPALALPTIVSVDEGLPVRRSRRGLALALLAGPVVFALAAVIWWVASQPSSSSKAAAAKGPVSPPTEIATEATATASTPPAETAPIPTAAVPSAAAEVLPTQPAPAPEPPPARAVAPPAPPPAWSPPPARAPAPTSKPGDKRKYDPEGI